MNQEEKRKKKDEADKLHIHAVLYFLLGILLNTCMTAVSIACVLPKIAVKTEKEAVSAVTSELVKDTVNASLGDYLESNKIEVLDNSIAEITEYIIDSVNNQTELTESELLEIRNLINVGIQDANDTIDRNTKTANDNLNNSMITLQEFVVNGDDEIANALKEYIDKYVVPGINDSLEMNSEDIITVNETIVQMGNEYESYRESNETNLEEIIKMIDTYKEETGEEINECQSELTEKMSNFCVRYDSYVNETDFRIGSIETALGDYVTIADFENFQNSYEVYKENVGNTVIEIENVLEELEEGKADKETLQNLSGNFDDLKVAYDSFTGENGAFESLKNRVINAETSLNQNSSSIVALEERIEQLEGNFQKLYPIGSVYMTFGNENPADLYGGTWEKVEDTFLMCAGSAYPVNSTGGSNTVTLNAENIPSLNIAGNTAAKNGVGTSSAGAYSGTVTSTGTYNGGTYSTSTNGDHQHTLPDWGVYWTQAWGNGNMSMALQWVNASDGLSDAVSTAGNHSHIVNIPSQTITSKGNLSIGNHSHTVNIPALSVTGNYTNNSLQSVDVTNKYVAVNVWKRVA